MARSDSIDRRVPVRTAPAVLLCAGLIGLSACGTGEVLPPPAPAAQAPYRIGSQDVVEVDVWKDGSLSATMPVRPDGYITVPLVGDVIALGKTTDEIEKDITQRLEPTLRSPLVTVLVKEANSAKFCVLGEVAHPGTFALHGPTTILEGVAMAGGLTPFADGDRLVLIRVDSQRRAHRYELSYKHAVSGGPPVAIAAGDTLFVP